MYALSGMKVNIGILCKGDVIGEWVHRQIKRSISIPGKSDKCRVSPVSFMVALCKSISVRVLRAKFIQGVIVRKAKIL
jgi:hypothetical protein